MGLLIVSSLKVFLEFTTGVRLAECSFLALFERSSVVWCVDMVDW